MVMQVALCSQWGWTYTVAVCEGLYPTGNTHTVAGEKHQEERAERQSATD